jgi:hypothetical protein
MAAREKEGVGVMGEAEDNDGDASEVEEDPEGGEDWSLGGA